MQSLFRFTGRRGIGRARNLSSTRSSAAMASNSTSTVVLLRHGQSTWNATPTFTGWCDPPLTENGISQAKASGRLLRDRGFHFDWAFTSTLQRAIVTCELALRGSTTPMEMAWQLNERHYGCLQGRRKDDPVLLETYGKEQLRSWRRDFHAAPPPLNSDHDAYLPPPAPLTESLWQCQQRVLTYWNESIIPKIQPGQTALIAAHSNTLRALVAFLDHVPTEHIPFIHIPNSVPCVYILKEGEPISPKVETAHGGSRGHWIFSAENHERLREEIGVSDSFVRSVFTAWDTNGDGVLSLEEITTGLRDLMGRDDVSVKIIAWKILEEIDANENDVLDLGEFELYAKNACEKLELRLFNDNLS